jgi:hypothetical protein
MGGELSIDTPVARFGIECCLTGIDDQGEAAAPSSVLRTHTRSGSSNGSTDALEQQTDTVVVPWSIRK